MNEAGYYANQLGANPHYVACSCDTKCDSICTTADDWVKNTLYFGAGLFQQA